MFNIIISIRVKGIAMVQNKTSFTISFMEEPIVIMS